MENTVRPAFNFLPVPNEECCPHNGRSIQLMYIEDMKPMKDMILFTQMCDAGYRMGRINEDYSKWNQCIYEDIDYKFYIENHKEFIEPNIIYEQLYDWLYNNYKDIFYYCEMSRSSKGFHIIFFFDVQRTKNNRMMCKSLTTFIIRKAFKDLGYSDIIEYPKVFDDCTESFYQACFFTLNNYKINKECTGRNSSIIIMNNYYSIKEIYDRLFCKTIKPHKKVSKDVESNSLWEIEYSLDNAKRYRGAYMNHHERYYLYRSVVGMCGGIDNIDENEQLINDEWENCAKQLPEGNNHDIAFYINEPTRNNWISWIKSNEEYCYVDNDLMNHFGYDIKYINKDNNENKINKKTNKITKTRIYL